ncbi:hypothetical protein [Mycolicibacterium novocastrense]|uniref:Transposase n=2 Tax=Mycolicibacterium novocastrense TaxID=59813 RepID=A0ABQ0KN45_MYCNV|nr:hypothetical protein [Mycolicibacterium novocastrense]GAT11012.1 transposase [Mycolicibacterium novocastrense]
MTCGNAEIRHGSRAGPPEKRLHSGIALFTPDQVHSGAWIQQWLQRDQALQAYYDTHPERFRKRPQTNNPNPVVGINLPPENDLDRLHAA